MRLFLALSFGMAWAFSLPLWLSDAKPDSSLMTAVGAAMMFTPAFAVLAVHLLGRRGGGAPSLRELARETGLGMGPDRRKTLGLVALGWLLPPVVVALTAALAVAAGVLEVDLESFSLLRERLGYEPEEALPMAVGHLLVVLVVQSVTVSAFLTMVFAFGEEWGWRGWMLPRLVSRWGVTGGLVVSGVIWGLWHFPATLRGYNYPELGAWAAIFFVGACILLSIPMGWLRLVTGSIWPAVAAHGALNATSGLVNLIGDSSEPPVLHLAGVGGLAGWVVLAVISMMCLRHLRLRRASGVHADQGSLVATTNAR